MALNGRPDKARAVVDTSKPAGRKNTPVAVKVQADGVTVPPSATNGWGYNPTMTAIILTGSYCDDVVSGTIHNVVVLFGCGLPGTSP